MKPLQGEDVIIKHSKCASCKPENHRGWNLKDEFSDTGMFARLAASKVHRKPHRDKILFDEETVIPEASYKDTSAFTHVFPDILDDIGVAMPSEQESATCTQLVRTGPLSVTRGGS